jgi:hypothetical protein
MSKHNKVNPGQYYVGGRLTPDEMARERMKQQRTPASTPASTPPPAPPARARADAREAKVHSAKNQGKDGHIRGAAAPTRVAKAKAAGRTRGAS